MKAIKVYKNGVYFEICKFFHVKIYAYSSLKMQITNLAANMQNFRKI